MVSKITKRFAVFDIDGTLIRWQLYHVIVDRLAKRGALGESADRQLHEARMAWKRREQPEGFKKYELKLIEVYEAALHKISTQIFDNIVNEVISEYKDQTYVYTRDQAKKLKQKGYILLAISGSHHELVEQVAKHYQFDDFIGSRYERSGKGFSGRKFIASLDKRSALSSMVKKHELSYKDSIAIGDSASDISMLELVEQPIAFNPDKSLFETADKKGWKIVLERKNMIYELEKQDGKYILAKTNIE